MFLPFSREQSLGSAKFFPTDETTKVLSAPPLDKAEAESRIKFYDKGLGWYCTECVLGMRANGTEGRIECPRCGTSAYFKEMSHRQRKCRLEKSKDVKVSPQVDGHFIARTKGKSTGYMVIWDTRYQRWECACEDFKHHKRYLWHKCKHVFSVERFIKAKEKPVEEPDKPCDAITRLEKLFGCQITGVLEAVPLNGNGTYSVKLSSAQKSGIKSEIETTLDVESLRSLGWKPPLQACQFAFVRLNSAETEDQDEVIDDDDALEARASAIADSYAHLSWKKFYGCLSKVERKLTGIDAGMIKTYYARKYKVSSVSELSERDREWVAAELQGATQHLKLRAKLEKEIRSSLSKNKCVECGTGIDFGKRRCRKCTDELLSGLLEKKGFHRTDGTGTTNASIRVPTFVLNQGVHRRFKTKTAV